MLKITKRNLQPTIESFLDSHLSNLGRFDKMFDKLTFDDVKSNIINKEEFQEIQISTPGIDKKNIHISLENNILTVSYKNEKKETEIEEYYSLREFYQKSFEKRYSLPKNSNLEDITSNYDKGILYIKIPKEIKSESKKRIVKVK